MSLGFEMHARPGLMTKGKYYIDMMYLHVCHERPFHCTDVKVSAVNSTGWMDVPVISDTQHVCANDHLDDLMIYIYAVATCDRPELKENSGLLLSNEICMFQSLQNLLLLKASF